MELYLFDKNKEVISIISNEDLTNYYQTQELNGLITSDIEGIYTKEIKKARYIGSQDVDDRSIFWRYKIDRLNTMGNSFFLKSTYELFDDLKGRTIIKDRRPDRWSVAQALAVILQDTGWEVGDIKSTNLASSSWYYLTPLEAFWDFLDKWRVEFKPRMVFSKGKVVAKYIDVADRLSDDYGKWYEYGDKLLTVVAEEESEHIATAFYGRGKGEEVGDGFGRRINFADIEWKTSKGDPLNKPKGQEWLEFPQATAEYGYEDGTPRYKVVEFSDIEESDELLEATYEDGLNEIRPKSHFRTNVLETELAELGETVAIIRDMDDIRYKTRIFELTRDFLNKNIKQIEFGDKLVRSRAEQSKEADNKLIEQEKQTIDWLNAIRDSITDSYFNDDGFNYELKIGNEYDLPAGYYSFDTPIDENPTKVVYMGAGKLLIANSKKPNGEWDWRTAATGDGIVADVVNTGTLNANLIKAGILMDRSGNTSLDLANGLLRINHKNGNYSEFSANGPMFYDGRTKTKYHHRTKVIKFSMGGDGQNPSVRWIPIGPEFNDFDWEASLSLSDTTQSPTAQHALQRMVLTQGHSGSTVLEPRFRNGQWEYPVTGYTIYLHQNQDSRRYSDVAGLLIITA